MKNALLASLLLVPFLCASAEAREFEAELELFEMRVGNGDDEFVFDSGFALAGDVDAFVLEVEGGSEAGPDLDEVGVKLLYARSYGTGTELLAGVRRDFRPGDDVAFAVMGAEQAIGEFLGAEGYVNLSEHGDVTGTAELVATLPITSSLIMEPRAELEWAAQDIPLDGIASGIGGISFAARLRQSIGPVLNVYIGAVHERLIGDTRAIARADGESGSATKAVIGAGLNF